MTSPVDIRPDHLEIVQGILREHLPMGVKVWVFGSRANWSTKDSSDLDLAVEGHNGLSHKVLGTLKDAFEDSTLPYTVDVVDLNRIGDSFRQIVKSQRVPLLMDGANTNTVPLSGSNGRGNEVRLGDVATIVMGQSPPGSTVSDEPGVALLNGPTEFGPHHPVPVQFTSDPRKFAQPGDVLFCVRGSTTGRMNWADQEYAIGRGVAAIRHTEDPTLQPLLRGAIEVTLPELLTAATGSTFPNVSASQLADTPYPDLSVKEQRAIAHVLGTLDDKIELNRRMNETLEAMAQALFKSWFVDFDPVRAKMEGRDTGLPSDLAALFPDRLVASELGEIPEGWEVKTMGEIMEVVGGTTPSTKVSEYWEEGIHCWATPKDLSSLSSPVLLDTERRVTDAGLDKIGSGLLPKGTLLLSSRAPIGYLAISEEPVAINQGFIAMRPVQGISNLFMLHWCGVFHDEIVNHANGSTFLEISKSNFRTIPLLVPAEEVMTAFDRLARALHEHIVSNERESRTLAVQRDSLLPRLVSGELGVGVV